MPIATIIALIQTLLALAPEIEGLADAVGVAVGLIQTGTPPTAAQQAQIDSALDAANAAVAAA